MSIMATRSNPTISTLIPTAAAAVRLLNEAGYYVIVVTNQSGVARGFFSEAAVKLFNAHLQDALLADGARIDAFYYCPHHPDGTVKELAIRADAASRNPACSNRRRATGRSTCSRSFLIGDKDHDLAAARRFTFAASNSMPKPARWRIWFAKSLRSRAAA